MEASEQIISPLSEECSIKQNIRPVGDIKQSFGLKQHRSSSNCCPLGGDCYLNFLGAKSMLGLNGLGQKWGHQVGLLELFNVGSRDGIRRSNRCQLPLLNDDFLGLSPNCNNNAKTCHST